MEGKDMQILEPNTSTVYPNMVYRYDIYDPPDSKKEQQRLDDWGVM